jgi:hypothetical protein
MAKLFPMKLDGIQPSQLYISTEKLAKIMKAFDRSSYRSLEPIPIKKLSGDTIFVDGHTRAFAAFLHGQLEVPVYWEYEELDWEAYEICVKWCKDAGIRTIAGLKNRVVSKEDYGVLWLDRCAGMQAELKARRGTKREI